MSTRVVLIDDSALVRKLLSRVLSNDPDIEVVGTAPDPFVGRDMIVEHQPDVIVLDVEMPRMDGITFLRKLMAAKPMPVIIVSSLTQEGSELAIEAYRAGAVDVVCKPRAAYTLGDLGQELVAKVKAAKFARPRASSLLGTPAIRPTSLPQLSSVQATHKVIAIGASTGGTVAVESIVAALPSNTPGIVNVQHMPAAFTKAYAERLNTLSAMEIKEAEHGDIVTPGKMIIARGDRHMVLRRSGALYRVELEDTPPVNRHRPAVDVLFASVAKYAGKNAMGVLLTGMGADGADGLLKMKEAGAVTVAQNEASSVVFGMPKAAIELGAADYVKNLDHMAQAIVDYGNGKLTQEQKRARAGS